MKIKRGWGGGGEVVAYLEMYLCSHSMCQSVHIVHVN